MRYPILIAVLTGLIVVFMASNSDEALSIVAGFQLGLSILTPIVFIVRRREKQAPSKVTHVEPVETRSEDERQ